MSGIVDQVRSEVGAMVSYALSSGLDVQPALVAVAAGIEGDRPLNPAETAAAVRAHRKLSALVAPAVPRTIMLLQREEEDSSDSSWLPSVGPIRLVRQLVWTSVLFMLAFIGLALSPEVNRTSGDILNSDGWGLLLNLLFVLAAAGLGASFSALFRVSRYIGEGTFDPKYESTYWMRLLLGLIAGLLLAELIPEAVMRQAAEGADNPFQIARPILALVGGFSAAVVFRILQRLVDAVESMFKGDASQLVQMEMQRVQAMAANQVVDARMGLSSSLIRLDQQIQGGAGSSEVAQSVRAMLDELLPAETPTLPPPAGTGEESNG